MTAEPQSNRYPAAILPCNTNTCAHGLSLLEVKTIALFDMSNLAASVDRDAFWVTRSACWLDAVSDIKCWIISPK